MGFLHRDPVDNGMRRRDRGRFLGLDKVDVQIDRSIFEPADLKIMEKPGSQKPGFLIVKSFSVHTHYWRIESSMSIAGNDTPLSKEALMARFALVVLVSVLFVSFVSPISLSAQSRVDLPNAFGIELLGRSALYSFVYQRNFGNPFALEAGLSAIGGGGSDDSDMLIFIPIGGKVYFVPKNGSPFITGGVNIVTAAIDSGPFGDDGTNTFFYAGLGFEYRSPAGFLFSGTAYGLISNEGSFFIWPGLHVGYAF